MPADFTARTRRLALLALPLVALLVATRAAAGPPEGPAPVGPAPERLTADEAASGWVQLFDGQDFSGLLVEGDAAVADGVLAIGGARPATVRVNMDLGDDFELLLYYRVEGPGGLHFRAESHGMRGSAVSGTTVPAPPPPAGAAPVWRELRCRCQRNRAGDGYDLQLEGRAAGGDRDSGTGMGLGVANSPAVQFDVPAGGKLFLRGAKARPDPAAGRWWKTVWGFGAILSAVLAALLVGVLLFARWMRRRPPPLAVPGAPPEEEEGPG